MDSQKKYIDCINKTFLADKNEQSKNKNLNYDADFLTC